MEKATLAGLKDGQKEVYITLLVVHKFPVREITTRFGKKVAKTELKVAELACPKCQGEWQIDLEHNITTCAKCGEKGVLGYVDLWRDQVDKFQVSDIITIIGGYGKIYQGNPNISPGITGLIKKEASDVHPA